MVEDRAYAVFIGMVNGQTAPLNDLIFMNVGCVQIGDRQPPSARPGDPHFEQTRKINGGHPAPTTGSAAFTISDDEHRTHHHHDSVAFYMEK